MNREREFFYDEVREGFYIPGIMKRAWGANLTILSEIDRICKKYEIPYYAAGGTLLGAVRDGQFIPWDDDIDILMLRKDFNHFVEIVEKELPKDMQFFSMSENKGHYGFISGVCKNRIGFEPELLRNYEEFPYFSTVDIFILDDFPEDPQEEEDWKQLILMLGKILQTIQNKKDDKQIMKLLDQAEAVLNFHFDRTGNLEHQLYLLVDTVFQSFNNGGGDKIGCAFYHFFNSHMLFHKSSYEKSIRVPFCNIQIPIPEGYDAVLREEYGDYHRIVKGGGHDYPGYKESEDKIKETFRDKWNFDYYFKEEDLLRPKIENFRDIVIHMVEALAVSQKELFEEYERGEIQACLQRLSKAQEDAIAFGDAIEQKKGEGSESVSVLEKYCEALYQAYMALRELLPMEDLSILSATVHKELKQKLKKPGYYLKKLRSALEKDFKRQVVFLPHSAKHFESLRPLVDALLQAGDTECKIIPIPYYDRYGDGSLKEMHYEGDAFPKEYEITDYRNYNFATELPDCIVINSPYDQFNQVWTVEPTFYCQEMKKYTNKLVYIPWFVTDEINPKDKEDGNAFYNMKYYVEVPGIFHSDLSIVQSEGMKKTYLAKIEEFAGKDVAKKMEKKIAGAGSCLLGEKEGQGIQNVVDCFRSFLLKA